MLNDCSVRDIDECGINYGGCSTDAICNNLDGTVKNGTHTCTCPPGLIGDGVKRCDIFVFQTKMSFQLDGLKKEDIVIQVYFWLFLLHVCVG